MTLKWEDCKACFLYFLFHKFSKNTVLGVDEDKVIIYSVISQIVTLCSFFLVLCFAHISLLTVIGVFKTLLLDGKI